jgi:1-acyl-sn-glycerol-3-phosphate acyltransferase
VRLLGGLASIWAWTALVLGVVLSFFVVATAALISLPFDRRRRFTGRTFRLCGVVLAALHPYWSFGVSGAVVRPRRRRTVFVSNHESQADPFLVSHLPWEMKWLSKQSLFQVPFLGWCMSLAGDVPIRRGEKDSASEAMGKMRRWLERDVPVMIFPEGTRSADGSLGAFKDGAFRLAIEAQADLFPLALRGTHEALPKHAWRFGRARARVRCGTPISTAGRTLADLEALKSEARAQIIALREALDQELAEVEGRGSRVEGERTLDP